MNRRRVHQFETRADVSNQRESQLHPSHDEVHERAEPTVERWSKLQRAVGNRASCQLRSDPGRAGRRVAHPLVHPRMIQYAHGGRRSGDNTTRSRSYTTGLPRRLQAGIEGLSGLSMADVKVHHNSDKPGRLNALAFAQGTDIHLGPGQGKHLAHEAWHVVQQKQGRVRPTRQHKGETVNDSSALEREADIMGARASSSAWPSYVRERGEHVSSELPTTPSPPVIQGKFGFELELTIAAEYVDGPDRLDPSTLLSSVEIGAGPGFKVHVDHQEKESKMGEGVVDKSYYTDKGAPIIELVTNPLKEFHSKSEEHVKTLAGNLVALANKLENARGKDLSLKDMGIATSANVKVGGVAVGNQNTDAYIHATYGISLGNMTKAFRGHGKAVEKGAFLFGEQEAKVYTKPADVADTMVAWVYQTYKDEDAYSIGSTDDLKLMGGLFTLLANYAINKKKSTGSMLLKNEIGPMFYKSSLNEVCALLPAKQQQLLKDKMVDIAKKLVSECATAKGKSLEDFDGTLSWRSLFRKVFRQEKIDDKSDTTGTNTNSDYFLQEMKNPYSRTLGPDRVGPKGKRSSAAVVENRVVAPPVGSRHRKIKKEGWEDFMLRYYNAIRAMNDPDKTSDDVRDAFIP